MTAIGKSIARVDAYAKVKGQALYPGDFNFPDSLQMKVLFSQRVHAIVKSIDISAAENTPGVLLVLTARMCLIMNMAWGFQTSLFFVDQGRTNRMLIA